MTENQINDAAETEVTFEKGSWQETLHKSSVLFDRSSAGRKRASNLLWQGAQTGIEAWLPNSDEDVNGEEFYSETLTALGKARKGDASKIKTVALAVRNKGLVLSAHANLAKAYAEAVRLTKTAQTNKAEDDAAEKAVEALAASVPSSTSTVDGAAAILLSKGVDGAVVAILDALGKDNEAAHRAFLRAVSVEVASRVQAKAQAAKAQAAAARQKAKDEKAAATPDKGNAPKATVKSASEKAPAKKTAAAKGKPVQSASKGDPNEKALPPKKAAAKGKPVAVRR